MDYASRVHNHLKLRRLGRGVLQIVSGKNNEHRLLSFLQIVSGQNKERRLLSFLRAKLKPHLQYSSHVELQEPFSQMVSGRDWLASYVASVASLGCAPRGNCRA